jgi:hypothetical protein
MTQKLEKARRLISEVHDSIKDRGKSHVLWDDAMANVCDALIAVGKAVDSVEAVSKHNKEIEGQKI